MVLGRGNQLLKHLFVFFHYLLQRYLTLPRSRAFGEFCPINQVAFWLPSFPGGTSHHWSICVPASKILLVVLFPSLFDLVGLSVKKKKKLFTVVLGGRIRIRWCLIYPLYLLRCCSLCYLGSVATWRLLCSLDPVSAHCFCLDAST